MLCQGGSWESTTAISVLILYALRLQPPTFPQGSPSSQFVLTGLQRPPAVTRTAVTLPPCESTQRRWVYFTDSTFSPPLKDDRTEASFKQQYTVYFIVKLLNVNVKTTPFNKQMLLECSSSRAGPAETINSFNVQISWLIIADLYLTFTTRSSQSGFDPKVFFKGDIREI